MYRKHLGLILPLAVVSICWLCWTSSAHAYPWGGDPFDHYIDLPLDTLPAPSETDAIENSITYPGHTVNSLGLHGYSPDGSGFAIPPDDGSDLPYSANSFFDVFVDINLDGNSWTASGVGEVHISSIDDLLPADTIFDTEMLQLDISGGTLPAGTMIRESHSQTSTGQIEIQDMGGGDFRMRSFFDIFTELSVDGGNTWLPSTGSVNLGSQTPEPSTLVLAGIGGALMWRAVRRRK